MLARQSDPQIFERLQQGGTQRARLELPLEGKLAVPVVLADAEVIVPLILLISYCLGYHHLA
jgi:hypothetical protein